MGTLGTFRWMFLLRWLLVGLISCTVPTSGVFIAPCSGYEAPKVRLVRVEHTPKVIKTADGISIRVFGVSNERIDKLGKFTVHVYFCRRFEDCMSVYDFEGDLCDVLEKDECQLAFFEQFSLHFSQKKIPVEIFRGSYDLQIEMEGACFWVEDVNVIAGEPHTALVDYRDVILAFIVASSSSYVIGQHLPTYTFGLLPKITGFLLMGIVAGPFGANLLSRFAIYLIQKDLNRLCLSFIAITAGMEVYFPALHDVIWHIVIIVTAITVFTVSFVGVGSWSLGVFEYSGNDASKPPGMLACLLLGAIMVARSPTTVFAVASSYGLFEGAAKVDRSKLRIVLVTSIISDLAVLLAFAVMTSVTRILMEFNTRAQRREHKITNAAPEEAEGGSGNSPSIENLITDNNSKDEPDEADSNLASQVDADVASETKHDLSHEEKQDTQFVPIATEPKVEDTPIVKKENKGRTFEGEQKKRQEGKNDRMLLPDTDHDMHKTHDHAIYKSDYSLEPKAALLKREDIFKPSSFIQLDGADHLKSVYNPSFSSSSDSATVYFPPQFWEDERFANRTRTRTSLPNTKLDSGHSSPMYDNKSAMHFAATPSASSTTRNGKKYFHREAGRSTALTAETRKAIINADGPSTAVGSDGTTLLTDAVPGLVLDGYFDSFFGEEEKDRSDPANEDLTHVQKVDAPAIRSFLPSTGITEFDIGIRLLVDILTGIGGSVALGFLAGIMFRRLYTFVTHVLRKGDLLREGIFGENSPTDVPFNASCSSGNPPRLQLGSGSTDQLYRFAEPRSTLESSSNSFSAKQKGYTGAQPVEEIYTGAQPVEDDSPNTRYFPNVIDTDKKGTLERATFHGAVGATQNSSMLPRGDKLPNQSSTALLGGALGKAPEREHSRQVGRRQSHGGAAYSSLASQDRELTGPLYGAISARLDSSVSPTLPYQSRLPNVMDPFEIDRMSSFISKQNGPTKVGRLVSPANQSAKRYSRGGTGSTGFIGMLKKAAGGVYSSLQRGSSDPSLSRQAPGSATEMHSRISDFERSRGTEQFGRSPSARGDPSNRIPQSGVANSQGGKLTDAGGKFPSPTTLEDRKGTKEKVTGTTLDLVRSGVESDAYPLSTFDLDDGMVDSMVAEEPPHSRISASYRPLWTRHVKAIFFVVFVFSIFYLCEVLAHLTKGMLRLEALLICSILASYVGHDDEIRKEIATLIVDFTPHVFLPFFTVTGASLRLTSLYSISDIAIIVCALRGVAILLSAFLGAHVAGFDADLRNNLGLTLFSQAGVALGLALEVAEQFITWGQEVTDVVIAVVCINQLLGPVLASQGLTNLMRSFKKEEEEV